jgi:hypothetical protein
MAAQPLTAAPASPQTIATSATPTLSIIIPTLDESAELPATLDALARARQSSPFTTETIVIDGGSRDDTLAIARRFDGLKILGAEPGRARQMNAGASAARGDWLFFLHADTHLREGAFAAMAEAMSGPADVAHAFELRFRSDRPAYRRLERGVAWRTRRFGLAYGDQGLLIHRDLFARLGGFRVDVKTEDLDLALRLRPIALIALMPHPLDTSPRMYEREPLWRRIAVNLCRMTARICMHYATGGAKRKGEWRRNR